MAERLAGKRAVLIGAGPRRPRRRSAHAAASIAGPSHPASKPTRAQYTAQHHATVPMAYKGSAIDVAHAALYFASDE